MGWSAFGKGLVTGAATEIGNQIDLNEARVRELIKEQTKDYRTRSEAAKKKRDEKNDKHTEIIQGFKSRKLTAEAGASYIKEHGATEALRALAAADAAFRNNGISYDKFFTFVPSVDSSTTIEQYVNSLATAPDIEPFMKTPGVTGGLAGMGRWWNRDANKQKLESAAPTIEAFKEVVEIPGLSDTKTMANYGAVPTTLEQKLVDRDAMMKTKDRLIATIGKGRGKSGSPQAIAYDNAVKNLQAIVLASTAPSMAAVKTGISAGAANTVKAIEEAMKTSWSIKRSGISNEMITITAGGTSTSYDTRTPKDKEVLAKAQNAYRVDYNKAVLSQIQAVGADMFKDNELRTYTQLFGPPPVLPARDLTTGSDATPVVVPEPELVKRLEVNKALLKQIDGLAGVPPKTIVTVKQPNGKLVATTPEAIREALKKNTDLLNALTAGSDNAEDLPTLTFQRTNIASWFTPLLEDIRNNIKTDISTLTTSVQKELLDRRYPKATAAKVNDLILEFDKGRKPSKTNANSLVNSLVAQATVLSTETDVQGLVNEIAALLISKPKK